MTYTPITFMRVKTAADRCEEVARSEAQQGGFDPPMTEDEVVASAAMSIELTDAQDLLDRLATLEALVESYQSDDQMGRLVKMVLDLLRQRGEFERIAKVALDQRDAALLALKEKS